jgi:hypothetical protein
MCVAVAGEWFNLERSKSQTPKTKLVLNVHF